MSAAGGSGQAGKKVALVSLGCPKNQVDSEMILGRLERSGARLVDDAADADVLIVNTCSFIDTARAESVEALVQATEWKAGREGRQVIAAGCLVQRSGGELAESLPEIDGFIGLDEVDRAEERLVQLQAGGPARLPAAGPATGRVAGQAPRHLLSPSWTAFVKIAEGCDQNCAFCAIPTFRGRMRSRRPEDLLAEIAALARRGVREVNLVAQDSSSYGRDIGLRDGLAGLLRAIETLDVAPAWVRLHYLYPGRISQPLIEALRDSSRIARYIDLPLQHADREILRAMGRPGSAESYLRQIDALREALPGAALRSGFIVGFPGETDRAFERLLHFVERARPESAGVFTYSHEEGTPAARLSDDVDPAVKLERRQALEELLESISHEGNAARIGQRLEVLVEGEAEDLPGASEGRWQGQAPEVDGRVVIEDPQPADPGEMIPVTITGAAPYELRGRRDAGR